jgi:hypothetical protein
VRRSTANQPNAISAQIGGYLRAQLLFEHDSPMPAGQIRAA